MKSACTCILTGKKTTWKNDAWKFAGTRYQLRDYSDSEIADIVRSYTKILNALADGGVRSYRAGGFCVEPFGRIRNCLLENGISIDSSVVPGAALIDDDKGIRFQRCARYRLVAIFRSTDRARSRRRFR